VDIVTFLNVTANGTRSLRSYYPLYFHGPELTCFVLVLVSNEIQRTSKVGYIKSLSSVLSFVVFT